MPAGERENRTSKKQEQRQKQGKRKKESERGGARGKQNFIVDFFVIIF